VWLNACQPQGDSTPIINTTADIQSIYVAIAVIEEAHTNSITNLLAGAHNPKIGLNRQLALYLESENVFIASKTNRGEPLQLIDRWGKPFVIVSRADAQALNVPATILGKDRPLIIWSMGPDERDDHGLNDDVSWKGP
jgi:hypothetical protein